MFKDRYDAARQLAQSLGKYKDRDDVVICAIPRGGLEIGYVLAQQLNAPLDVIFSKKIGAPGQPELAIGAVTREAQDIDPFFKDNAMYADYLASEIPRIRTLLEERYNQYKPKAKPIPLKDKIVILTDDGVATGNTLLLALEHVAQQKPKKIVIAIPVGPKDTIEKLKHRADEVVCLLTPITFFGIGQFYQQFDQVDDQEAIRLLREANQ